MSNFSSSFTRRPTGGGNASSAPLPSLLGDPPIARNQVSRQQHQSHGGGFGESNYRQDIRHFEEEYDAMMEEFGDYNTGSNGEGGMSNQRSQRAGGGGGSGMFQQSQLFDAEFSGDIDNRRGERQVNWPQSGGTSGRRQDFSGFDSGERGRGASTWTTNADARDFDSLNNRPSQFNQQNLMQTSNSVSNQQLQGLLGQLSQQQNLGNLNANQLLGMLPNQAQSALTLLQQQAAAAAVANANPMQLLLGNLPAFNADALGKQILNAAAAAASGGPFGQGVGSQMPPPLMGIRTDGSRPFDRSSDHSRSARDRSPFSRHDRKRGGDRYDDSDRKRPRGRDDNKGRVLRTSLTSSNSRGKSSGGSSNNNRNTNNRSPRRNDSNKDKPSEKGNEEKAKVKASEEAKEGDSTKKKETDENEIKDEKSAEVVGENKKSDKKEAEEKKKSKYDSFPSSLLVCKVCQKTMNDANSFESHLSGRAHLSLMDLLKERFQKRADLLMAESSYSEEGASIELDRQKRAGKGGGMGNKGKNHCKMCDCNYAKTWGAHKEGIHHRTLKEFLHPTCRVCDAQFVHRMDWIHHLFSTTHFRKLTELKETGKNIEEHENCHEDLLFTLSIEMGKDEHFANCITVRNLDWKVPLKEELQQMLQDDLELPEGDISIPEKYDETVAVGRDAIIQTVGYCCKICKVYITQERDIELHLTNKSHFNMYVAYLKKVERIREELAKEKEAAENKAKIDENTENTDENQIVDEKQENPDENQKNENDDDENVQGEDHANKIQQNGGENCDEVETKQKDDEGDDDKLAQETQDSDPAPMDSKQNNSGVKDGDAEVQGIEKNEIVPESVPVKIEKAKAADYFEAQEDQVKTEVPEKVPAVKKETAVELKPVVTKLAPPAATPRGGVSKQTAVRARGRGTGPTRGTPSRGNAANVTRGGRGGNQTPGGRGYFRGNVGRR